MVYLPDYVEYQYVSGPPLRSSFPMASDDAIDLLAKMFAYDPKSRISVQQALEHRYLTLTIQLGDWKVSFFHSLKSCLGTFYPRLCLQFQISSLDQLQSGNISIPGFLILIHMRVLLYCHLHGSRGE